MRSQIDHDHRRGPAHRMRRAGLVGALSTVFTVVACQPAARSPVTTQDSPIRTMLESSVPAHSAESSTDASGEPVPAEPSLSATLAPDRLADVVTDDLVMRSRPGVTDESVILEKVLQPGDRVLILDGPEYVTFYDWYLVQPLGDSFEQIPVGWVAAASRGGDPWIASTQIECPTTSPADAFELDSFHPLELLHCLGDRQIQVTVQVRGICAGYVIGEPNYTIEPAWLGMGSTCGWGREGVYLSVMQPYLDPSVGIGYPAGAGRLDWYRLTGQLDHPESGNCVLRELPDGDPRMPPAPDLTPEQVVLGCRSLFAVQHAVLVAEAATEPPAP